LMALDWKMLINFMDIWNILQAFGLFNDHLVHLCSLGTFFSGFGITHQEKSGNPASDHCATACHRFETCFIFNFQEKTFPWLFCWKTEICWISQPLCVTLKLDVCI
jgi:hypothetical protein